MGTLTTQNCKIVGALNLSPESFYTGSIATTKSQIKRKAEILIHEGADIIDIGAMSTAPYLKTHISEIEEAKRLSHAVKAIRSLTNLPLSIDTSRPLPMQAGLEEGANILNDVTGLHHDKSGPLAGQFEKVILMAHPNQLLNRKHASPYLGIKNAFGVILRRAKKAGIKKQNIILDPGIGFFRDSNWPWWNWDLNVLKQLPALCKMAPLLIGVSRKSFIGEVLKIKNPEDRLAGSLGGAAWAALNGASYIRTHDVKRTREAVTLALSIQNAQLH